MNRIEYNIIYIIAVTVAGSQLYNIGSSTHNYMDKNLRRARNLGATHKRNEASTRAGAQAGWQQAGI